MSPDDYPQLAPHHFDGLSTRIDALNTTIAKAEDQRHRDHQKMLAAIEKMTAASELVAKNLSALNDLPVPARTNGNGHHHEENDDERRTGSDS